MYERGIMEITLTPKAQMIITSKIEDAENSELYIDNLLCGPDNLYVNIGCGYFDFFQEQSSSKRNYLK